MSSNNWFGKHTETIGTHGLTGEKRGDVIAVKGPCGGGHTMNLDAARELRDWLSEKLNGDPAAARSAT